MWANKMSIVERFYSKWEYNPPTGCWLWNGGVVDAHGTMSYKGKVHRAHRLSYEIHFGEIPEGMVVRHKCNIKPCVNPDHLTIGTPAQNTADCIEAGDHISRIPSKFNPRSKDFCGERVVTLLVPVDRIDELKALVAGWRAEAKALLPSTP